MAAGAPNQMYVKIFAQIYDSSIAEDYLVRLVFEDFLILADKDGHVDMTAGAIARRTNVPIEVVSRAIERLSSPDPESRSPNEEGRRIVLLDPHRTWGWRIVNYTHYRNMRDDEARKEYFRERKREQRARSKDVLDSLGQSNDVHQCHLSKKEEARSKQNPCRAFPARCADPRYEGCKEAIEAYWRSKNPGTQMPWDGSEAKALSSFLRACPEARIEDVARLLENRAKSVVNHGDRPRRWLPTLTSYGTGPIDRFGKPILRDSSGEHYKSPSASRERISRARDAINRELAARGLPPVESGGGTDRHTLPASGPGRIDPRPVDGLRSP